MKEISLRVFQQGASKHLNDLPLTLTRYNKPMYVITSVDTFESGTTSVISKGETLNDLREEVADIEHNTVVTKSFGRCQAINCPKPATDEITTVGEGGYEKTRRLCKFHAAQARKETL